MAESGASWTLHLQSIDFEVGSSGNTPSIDVQASEKRFRELVWLELVSAYPALAVCWIETTRHIKQGVMIGYDLNHPEATDMESEIDKVLNHAQSVLSRVRSEAPKWVVETE